MNPTEVEEDEGTAEEAAEIIGVATMPDGATIRGRPP